MCQLAESQSLAAPKKVKKNAKTSSMHGTSSIHPTDIRFVVSYMTRRKQNDEAKNITVYINIQYVHAYNIPRMYNEKVKNTQTRRRRGAVGQQPICMKNIEECDRRNPARFDSGCFGAKASQCHVHVVRLMLTIFR